jgi:murein DD-endopeptidase MepM/ murein hydrolase activator NlpD
VRRPARILLALLVLGTPAAPAPRAGDSPLRVEVLARQLAPGEPVRVVVDSDAPLSEVEGELFGEPLAFVAESAARTRFASWAAVALDRAPGAYVLDVRAASEGKPVPPARIPVTVVAKVFPEQRLTVEEKYVSPSKESQERIALERKRLDAIYARRTPVPSPAASFAKPVPGEPTSRFGLKRFFNDQPRAPHSGLDLRASTGTPVKASGPGEVVFAGDLYFSGNTVILDHGGGLFTLYAHLSRIDVPEGRRVTQGAVLGKSGATGRVTGPHLHWGARVGETVVDPRALLDPALFRVSPVR